MTDLIRIPGLAGRTLAVLGLGKSGLVAAKALKASGATVWAWDDSAAQRAQLASEGIEPVDLGTADWTRIEALVLSPGIPHSFPKPHPIAAKAKAANKPIIGDVELLLRAQPHARFLAITGTNGKSTTTALSGHILASAGRQVAVGGNIGTPALALPALGAAGIYVLELSSYQLEITPSLKPTVAILLNITPDHIDRHGDMAGYIAAKERIFRRQSADDTAIIGIDDEPSRAMRERIAARKAARVVAISSIRPASAGVSGADGKLVDDLDAKAETVLDLTGVATLPGEHNWQNAAAAYAAMRSLGLQRAPIVEGLRTYPGLAHRQEMIATINGVRYINDSKATNADATQKALVCYQPIYWILGGKPKEGGIESLRPLFPRVAHAYLIGEASAAFARTLKGQVAATECGTLERAVASAHAQAQADHKAGAVVLLSPACASFDQFANFEQRGEAFRQIVLELGNGNGQRRAS
ncbi:UDP-N-acetylmuramoyl-L-alanine--D-glutamate ligase [Hypericibacter sp.]|uniref:UDP-N-acetylmuramoyl-L-alanine--D-glutamate ligase n=1 Tax=Hypericibacter sp. TaxID=2705401 RepID=UPI003D6CEAA0